MTCQQMGTVFGEQIASDILEVSFVTTFIEELVELRIVVGSLIIALGQHQVFSTVDRIHQTLGRMC